MSKTYHMHDYVVIEGDKSKVVRKYVHILDGTYSFKDYEVSFDNFKTKPFKGQRVDGYVRAGKYVVRGLFLDPNIYT